VRVVSQSPLRIILHMVPNQHGGHISTPFHERFGVRQAPAMTHPRPRASLPSARLCAFAGPTECRRHGRGRKEGEAIAVYACLNREANAAWHLICPNPGPCLVWSALPPFQPTPQTRHEAQRGRTKIGRSISKRRLSSIAGMPLKSDRRGLRDPNQHAALGANRRML